MGAVAQFGNGYGTGVGAEVNRSEGDAAAVAIVVPIGGVLEGEGGEGDGGQRGAAFEDIISDGSDAGGEGNGG